MRPSASLPKAGKFEKITAKYPDLVGKLVVPEVMMDEAAPAAGRRSLTPCVDKRVASMCSAFS